jgi:hypothetical protein
MHLDTYHDLESQRDRDSKSCHLNRGNHFDDDVSVRTTTKGLSEVLGRALYELCDVEMFETGYKHADTELEDEKTISSHLYNAFAIPDHVEHANTSCIEQYTTTMVGARYIIETSRRTGWRSFGSTNCCFVVGRWLSGCCMRS